jgi:hypothetical protein
MSNVSSSNGPCGVRKNGVPGATGRALLNIVSVVIQPPRMRLQAGLMLLTRGHGWQGAAGSGQRHWHGLQQQLQQVLVDGMEPVVESPFGVAPGVDGGVDAGAPGGAGAACQATDGGSVGYSGSDKRLTPCAAARFAVRKNKIAQQKTGPYRIGAPPSLQHASEDGSCRL